MLSDNQFRTLLMWFLCILAVEIIMLIFNKKLPLIYAVIGGVFLVGFLLRLLNIYPGKSEPVILDLLAFFIAFIMGGAAYTLNNSPFRYLLIFISSLIVIPHIIYIITKP